MYVFFIYGERMYVCFFYLWGAYVCMFFFIYGERMYGFFIYGEHMYVCFFRLNLSIYLNVRYKFFFSLRNVENSLLIMSNN
jgi:hypothetical protein